MLVIKHLTPLEAGILPQVVQGLQYKEIAQLRNTSVRAIKFHVSNIWRKLKVSNREDFLSRYGQFKVSVEWVPYEHKI